MRTIFKALPLAFALAASFSVQALTPGSGTWVKESATYGTPNLQNAYVFVPKNTVPEVKNGKRALMLNLHQCGGSATGVMNYFKWEATAEKYGMVVVAPTVPAGSRPAGAGCWDWLGKDHSRFNRDSGPLKKLIDSVMARGNLDIDPQQVYVTGFSAGAGETHVLGCMAPEFFAGVGLVHAPPLGIAAADEPMPTPEQLVAICKSYSGGTGDYSKQIFSVTYGDRDTLTTPEMGRVNLEGMKWLYGANDLKSSTPLSNGVTVRQYAGEGVTRIAEIEIPGIGHNWPTTANSIDYPAFITDWFFKNNKALVVNQPPVVTIGVTQAISFPVFSVSGKITDDGEVTSASIELLKYPRTDDLSVYEVAQKDTLTLASDGSYSKSYSLKDGNYVFRVSATDNGTPALTTSRSSLGFIVSTSAPEVPGKPVSCGVTASTICLQWTAAKGAATYNVNFAGTTNSAASSVRGTTVTISGLAADTPYAFEVKGSNSYGVGPASVSDTIRTATAYACSNHEGYFYTHLYAKRIYRVYKNFVTSYYLTGSDTPVKYSFSKMTLSETRPGHFELGACK